LTALPSAVSPIVSRDGQPAPAEPLLEPLRRLHTTLQLGDMVDHDRQAPRLILFLSADAGDGESTAIAGLAAVQRDAGERVAVIEADLRRPVQAGLLGANNPRGLTEVLTGRISIGEALQRVGPGSRTGGVGSESGVDDSDRIAATGTRSSAQAVAVAAGSSTLAEPVANLIESPAVGSISLLAGGEPAANPPALLASPAMTELLHSLANDFDYVLIDAPSPLQVSDVMPLLGAVDGIVIVARAQHTRTVSAERLVQLLSRSASAPVLGVVANAISRADIERYGFSSAHRRRGWRDRLAL
jgi:Mrp family chromosome partitioning ATPase